MMVTEDGDVLIGDGIVVVERHQVAFLCALLIRDELICLGELRAEGD